jgi:hypothetical protein
MVPELNPILHLFTVGDRMLDRLVGDFSDVEWRVKDAAGHSPRWITGHLTTYRLRVLELMGLPPMMAEWTGAFGRGTSDTDVPDTLEMRDVVQAFHDAHRRMSEGWAQLTPEMVTKPLGRTLPDGSDTVEGSIRFLAWHEAYHSGQLGLLRRLAGKPGIA